MSGSEIGLFQFWEFSGRKARKNKGFDDNGYDRQFLAEKPRKASVYKGFDGIFCERVIKWIFGVGKVVGEELVMVSEG